MFDSILSILSNKGKQNIQVCQTGVIFLVLFLKFVRVNGYAAWRGRLAFFNLKDDECRMFCRTREADQGMA